MLSSARDVISHGRIKGELLTKTQAVGVCADYVTKTVKLALILSTCVDKSVSTIK
mgnify:CR=1 FL=1